MGVGMANRRQKPPSKEFGKEALVLTDLLCDGAVWSSVGGLYVDRSIQGPLRLPPIRVCAATARAAEYAVWTNFSLAHGCLELPIHRVLSSAQPELGSVQDCVDTEVLTTIRLPYTWAKPSSLWHPVVLFDAQPSPPAAVHSGYGLPRANEVGSSGTGADDDFGDEEGGTTDTLERRLRAPLA